MFVPAQTCFQVHLYVTLRREKTSRTKCLTHKYIIKRPSPGTRRQNRIMWGFHLSRIVQMPDVSSGMCFPLYFTCMKRASNSEHRLRSMEPRNPRFCARLSTCEQGGRLFILFLKQGDATGKAWEVIVIMCRSRHPIAHRHDREQRAHLMCRYLHNASQEEGADQGKYS